MDSGQFPRIKSDDWLAASPPEDEEQYGKSLERGITEAARALYSYGVEVGPLMHVGLIIP